MGFESFETIRLGYNQIVYGGETIGDLLLLF